MAILRMSDATNKSMGAHFATKWGADKTGAAFVGH